MGESADERLSLQLLVELLVAIGKCATLKRSMDTEFLCPDFYVRNLSEGYVFISRRGHQMQRNPDSKEVSIRN